MQAAFLESADQAAVSHAVREVLERRGALIHEHVSSRVQFHSMPTGSERSWSRSGYVGIYQHVGEREVEVRLVLRARWPHRIFWGTAIAVLAIAILTWLVQPEGTTWFVLAFLCGLALLVATLLYMNTWRAVRDQERAVMEEIEAEIKTEAITPALITAQERALEDAEAELAGEVERVRLAQEHKSAPKPKKEKAPKEPREKRKLAMPKLSIGRKKEAPPEDDLEARRAELLARKRELESESSGEEKP